MNASNPRFRGVWTAQLLGTTPFTRILGWGTFVVLGVSLLVFTFNPFGLPRDGVVFHYYNLGFFIWVLVITAELFIRALRAPAKSPWLPRLLLMGLILFSFATCLAMVVGSVSNLSMVKSDYIGQSWFPRGDSITISKVYRTRDRLVVEGHYDLVSGDQARLALHLTSTNAAKNTKAPEDSLQEMRISNGQGDFKLFHSLLVPGLPHLSMYADGQSFADLFFGAKSEALAESKLILGGNRSDAPVNSLTDQIVVEHLAMRMLAAIRDKDDDALKALPTDRVKGWGDALPQFAFEMRERFQEMRGRPFAMQIAETAMQGDAALVKCTDPQQLNGIYLALFFVKTADGWKNGWLHNAPPSMPLQDFWQQVPPAQSPATNASALPGNGNGNGERP